jgi:hypothetical protein
MSDAPRAARLGLLALTFFRESQPDMFLKKASAVCQEETNTIQWHAGESNNDQMFKHFLSSGLELFLIIRFT